MSVSRRGAAGPSKHDLIQWAAKRRELDLVSKTILKSLAYFAMDDGDTWATVETLAEEANCSVRTVQYRLRALSEGGYVADTGRTWRLKNSTRSVPIYILQPTIEAARPAVSEPASMGANPAPIDEAWVQTQAGMGATVCTRIDHLGSPETSDEVSLRARDSFDEAYREVEAAYPKRGLGWTEVGPARLALADVLGQGVALADVVAAAQAYAVDPAIKRPGFGPVGLQRWLGEGRFRGWLPEREDLVNAVAGVAAGGGFAGPGELRAAILEKLGQGFALTLDHCGWSAGERLVTASTSWAHSRLLTVIEIIEQQGAALAAPGGKA